VLGMGASPEQPGSEGAREGADAPFVDAEPSAPVPPPLPRPSEPNARRRRRVVAGVLLGVLVALGFVVALRIDLRFRRVPPIDIPVDGGGPTTVESFRGIVLRAKQPIGIAPIADGTGVWHWRVRSKDGRVDQVESVSPSGRVHETITIEWDADRRTRKFIDGYGVHRRTQLWTDDSMVETREDGSMDGCVSKTLGFDERDRVVEERCRDASGRPTRNEEGCVVLRIEYAPEGHPGVEKCRGSDGRATTDRDGAHEVRFRHDAAGLLVATSYLDTRGLPVADREGCHQQLRERDAAGNIVAFVCAEKDGSLHRPPDGVPVVRAAYDTNGCMTRREFLNVTRRPVLRAGYARLDFERDALCTELRVERRGLVGELVAAVREPTIRSYVLDARGQRVEERCENEHQQPVDCISAERSSGALVKVTRDARGRIVSRRGFTVDGIPSALARDYPHEERMEWNGRGQVATLAYFDEKGQAATIDGSISRRVSTYDDSGLHLTEKGFGKNGEPVAGGTRCHEIRRSYDEERRIAGMECRGVTGELAGSQICLGGVCWADGAARIAVERKPGETVKNSFFAPDGRLLGRIDCAAESCYD